MESAMEIGERVAMAGADGKPDRVGEITGVMQRAEGPAYEVRALSSKKARFVPSSELFRLRPA